MQPIGSYEDEIDKDAEYLLKRKGALWYQKYIKTIKDNLSGVMISGLPAEAFINHRVRSIGRSWGANKVVVVVKGVSTCGKVIIHPAGHKKEESVFSVELAAWWSSSPELILIRDAVNASREGQMHVDSKVADFFEDLFKRYSKHKNTIESINLMKTHPTIHKSTAPDPLIVEGEPGHVTHVAPSAASPCVEIPLGEPEKCSLDPLSVVMRSSTKTVSMPLEEFANSLGFTTEVSINLSSGLENIASCKEFVTKLCEVKEAAEMFESLLSELRLTAQSLEKAGVHFGKPISRVSFKTRETIVIDKLKEVSIGANGLPRNVQSRIPFEKTCITVKVWLDTLKGPVHSTNLYSKFPQYPKSSLLRALKTMKGHKNYGWVSLSRW